MKTIFAKYNSERLPTYQIVTKIVVDDNRQRYALKEALNCKAKEHLKNIYKNYELLKSTYNTNLVKPTKVENGLLFDMVGCVSLEKILLDAIDQHDNKAFKKYIDKFLNFVDEMVFRRNVHFIPSQEFENVFGKWEINEPQDIVKIANIDLIFGNIFIDQNDEFILIDYEWVFDFEVPKSYMLWRTFFIFLTYHGIEKSIFEPYNLFNLHDTFLAWDKNFSDFVHGVDRKHFLTEQVKKQIHFFDREGIYANPVINVNCIQLFIDKGNGFSEKNSIKLSAYQTDEIQKFTFDFIGLQNIKALRLDPLNECCVIEIKSLHVKKENEIIDLLPYVHSNAEIHHGNIYFFATEDSQIYFNGLDPNIFENAHALSVILRYLHISKDALHVSAKQINQELATKEANIQALNQELADVYTSKSWKMTRPVRILKRIIIGKK